jgi:hypothetical protein
VIDAGTGIKFSFGGDGCGCCANVTMVQEMISNRVFIWFVLEKSCQSCDLFDCELLRQASNPNLKLTRLDDGFVIRTDKRKILTPKFEVKRTTLTRLETRLREASQTFSRRRDRSNEIANVNKH